MKMTQNELEKQDEKIFNINIRIKRYKENFKLDDIKQIPTEWGAYVINHPEGIYIGSSSAERGLRQRISIYKWKEFVGISYYVTENEIDALILEYILIKELKPELNINGNRTGKRLKNGRIFSSGRISEPRYVSEDEISENESSIKDLIKKLEEERKEESLKPKKFFYDNTKKVYVPCGE